MLRILILSDGRPGHFNLSEGIAIAASRLAPAVIERRTMKRGRWPGRIAAALVNAGVSPNVILSRIYSVAATDLPRCDLIVSAGAETLAANVAAAQALGAPNVFYGSLRYFRPRDFSLVLTSYARQLDAPNRVMTLKPAAFDPASLPLPTATSKRMLGVVVGGPAPGFAYTESDWAALERTIEGIADAGDALLSVSNSRRTPEAVSDRLAAKAQRWPDRISRFIDVRRPDAARLTELLATVDGVLVTADSSSMISEAVWARRRVIALEPAGARMTADEASYRDYLSANGWVGSCSLPSCSPDDVHRALATVCPMTQNPADDLAKLLAERIPSLTAIR